MTAINQLSAVDSVNTGDLFVIFSQNNGDARKAALNVVAEAIGPLIDISDDKRTQYSAPNATGFSVQINNDSLSIWLILTPLAGYAAGTLVLPSLANCADKQEILVNSTQAVTTLTVSGNGANVLGAPSALTANGFFKLRFDAVMQTWYRVG